MIIHLSQSKLPNHSLCTTRGSLPRNINSHSDSVSHQSSYLGLIALQHLHLINSHTYKQHTSMHSLRSLDLPRLSLLSVTTRVWFPVITSALILDSVIPLWLPRLGLFTWTLIIAACPDLCLLLLLRLCLIYAVSTAGDWPCSVWPFLINKAANGSLSVWCFATEGFAKQRSSSIDAVNVWTHSSSLATRFASTSAAATHHAHRGTCYSVARAAHNSTPNRCQPATCSSQSSNHANTLCQPTTRLSWEIWRWIHKMQRLLLQCSLFVNQQPSLYPTESSRIAFVCSLLTGKALDWATAVWRTDGTAFPTFDLFLHHFREVFEHPAEGRGAGEQLLALSQGRGTAADYALSFRTLAAQTTWVEDTLKLLFRKGLNAEL